MTVESEQRWLWRATMRQGQALRARARAAFRHMRAAAYTFVGKKLPEIPGAPSKDAQVEQLEMAVRFAIGNAYGGDLLPPEELRLHVGTSTTAANFWAQGASSARRTLEIFGDNPDGPILDWGCGSGRTLNWLKRHEAWRANWHGCDVDPDAIAWLKRKHFANAVVCGDLPPLPYPENTFVGVYAYSVLTHIPPEHHDAWYAEIRRVLRPGGRVYLTVQGEVVVASGRISDREILQQFKECGHALQKHAGHYKDAALVSEAYTRRLLERHFEIEFYKRKGYQNMDAFLARKVGEAIGRTIFSATPAELSRR